MGCTSSTQVVTDPHTGQTKNKHKLGGSYPGQRRHQHAAYTPPATDFNEHGQATSHFVSYGGGNALVLQQGGIAQPQTGGKETQYIQVTLPDGVYGGQTIHVQAPDGQLNEIIVPTGFGPGSTFTVEFADDPKFPEPYKPSSHGYDYPTAPVQPVAEPDTSVGRTNGSDHDDGFATGFNNPNFTPSARPTNSNYDAYPSAEDDARPVYPTNYAKTY